jgi:hypothetical protein
VGGASEAENFSNPESEAKIARTKRSKTSYQIALQLLAQGPADSST